MLEIRFLNVGDGDTILIWDRAAGFRLLVDAGREDVSPVRESLRTTAWEHLKRLGVDRLDTVVITHLHKDHFFGLGDILREIPIGEVYSGWFPAAPGRRLPEDPLARKTVRGMTECLNRWAGLTEQMSAAGTELRSVPGDILGLKLTEGLYMDLRCPDPAACREQRRIWDAMFAGEDVSEEAKYRASKARNPNSLRLTLRWAGRRVELAGDCYGTVWEGEDLEQCDILKIPHHGDAKSLTPRLVEKLGPAHAVISCGMEYKAGKDRPSRAAAELLERQGAEIWYTDAFDAPWHPGEKRESVNFAITDGGEIIPPDRFERFLKETLV